MTLLTMWSGQIGHDIVAGYLVPPGTIVMTGEVECFGTISQSAVHERRRGCASRSCIVAPSYL